MTFSVEGMAMPKGVMHLEVLNYAEGDIREIRDYSIKEDTYVARWDTIISGEQCSHASFKPDSIPVNQWMNEERAAAVSKFRELDRPVNIDSVVQP